MLNLGTITTNLNLDTAAFIASAKKAVSVEKELDDGLKRLAKSTEAAARADRMYRLEVESINRATKIEQAELDKQVAAMKQAEAATIRAAQAHKLFAQEQSRALNTSQAWTGQAWGRMVGESARAMNQMAAGFKAIGSSATQAAGEVTGLIGTMVSGFASGGLIGTGIAALGSMVTMVVQYYRDLKEAAAAATAEAVRQMKIKAGYEAQYAAEDKARERSIFSGPLLESSGAVEGAQKRLAIAKMTAGGKSQGAAAALYDIQEINKTISAYSGTERIMLEGRLANLQKIVSIEAQIAAVSKQEAANKFAKSIKQTSIRETWEGIGNLGQYVIESSINFQQLNTNLVDSVGIVDDWAAHIKKLGDEQQSKKRWWVQGSKVEQTAEEWERNWSTPGAAGGLNTAAGAIGGMGQIGDIGTWGAALGTAIGGPAGTVAGEIIGGTVGGIIETLGAGITAILDALPLGKIGEAAKNAALPLGVGAAALGAAAVTPLALPLLPVALGAGAVALGGAMLDAAQQTEAYSRIQDAGDRLWEKFVSMLEPATYQIDGIIGVLEVFGDAVFKVLAPFIGGNSDFMQSGLNALSVAVYNTADAILQFEVGLTEAIQWLLQMVINVTEPFTGYQQDLHDAINGVITANAAAEEGLRTFESKTAEDFMRLGKEADDTGDAFGRLRDSITNVPNWYRTNAYDAGAPGQMPGGIGNGISIPNSNKDSAADQGYGTQTQGGPLAITMNVVATTPGEMFDAIEQEANRRGYATAGAKPAPSGGRWASRG